MRQDSIPRRVRRAGAAQGVTLAFAGFLPILSILSLAPAVPTLIAHFRDVPNAGLIVPLLVTTPGLMVALLSPLAGLVADRHGRRLPILFATFFYAFAGAAPVVFGDLWAVLLSRVLVGVSETFVLVIVNALFADYYDEGARRTWITMQGILGPFLGAASIAGAGALAGANWSYVFLIYLLAFPIFLAMLLFFFEPERVPHHAVDADQRNASAEASQSRAFSWGTAAAYCSVTIFSSIIYYVFTVNGGLAFQAIGVEAAGRIGAIMGMAGLAVLPGALVFNLISRRWSGERVIATFLLFLGLGTGGMGISTSVAMMTVFAFVQQFGAGMTVAGLIFWVSRLLPPQHRGRGFGLWTSAFFAAQFISPAIVGIIGGAGGGVLMAFTVMGALSVVMSVVILTQAHRLPKPLGVPKAA
ncbi:MFS transporter [Sphingomonas sp. 2SG]|uniref:MFS transporter n=1 Tax=Sphingomonas sp. 2SG TaxID=2502201 RepID=UPI0010F598BC|nr:MFS transporter [Sphingomonas sp. 2SG]